MAQLVEAVTRNTEGEYGQSALTGLLPALKRLDSLLERAVTGAQEAYGPETAADPYLGLYIGQDEVGRLLDREPGAPAFSVGETDPEAPLPDPGDGASRLIWLQSAFGLSPFDVDLILIALAPELDLRYERLYAYLQDDVTRRRPTVDLALNLLCSSVEARLMRRIHFTPDSPAIRHGLLRLIPDPTRVEPPLLDYYLKLDEQIVRLLLGQEGLDSRLVRFCQRVDPANGLGPLPLPAVMKQALLKLASNARKTRAPLQLNFSGPRGVGKRSAAEAFAAEIGAPLLTVDLARLLETSADFEHSLRLLLREAWFEDAVLYLAGLDVLQHSERTFLQQCLLDALAEDWGITILAGERSWPPAGSASRRGPLEVIQVPFPAPAFGDRRSCWESQLATAGIILESDDLDALAGRFCLTTERIARAIATVRSQALWQEAMVSADLDLSGSRPQPTIRDLFAAARSESRQELAALAHKIDPVYTWDDLVLPEDNLAQLREICRRVTQSHRVMDEWGFDQKLSLGKGTSALFAGPTGTGKTMAAEVIAHELGLDLYRIDLSGIVSKYIGETEKNLDRIFTAAKDANAILFFDEADSLFGKRSEVRDSHDRYANIEIAYLLQKMEQYDGIAILATNLRGNLDDAFVRRLAFTIHFPTPDESSRRRIWSGIWPAGTPLADDVDLDFLARQHKLSGGNIKNIALAAAFLAADDGLVVTMAHLLHATRREYQKLGKVLTDAELNGTESDLLLAARSPR